MPFIHHFNGNKLALLSNFTVENNVMNLKIYTSTKTGE